MELIIRVWYSREDMRTNTYFDIECSQDINEAMIEADFAYADGKAQILCGDKVVYEKSKNDQVIDLDFLKKIS